MGFNHKKSHDEVRSSLCGLCFKRGELRKISEEMLSQLKTLIKQEYDLSDQRFQTVLCVSCIRALSAHSKNPGNPGRKLPSPSYQNMTPPPAHSTRSTDDSECECTVCQIFRSNQGFRHTNLLEEQFWNILFPDQPYPSTAKSERPQVESRCGSCYSLIGKGRVHKCNKRTGQDNLHKMVKSKSLKSKEKIGAKVIKGIFDDKNVNKRGGTVMLASGGSAKLPVSLSIKMNKIRFSHENLRRLQVVMGQSDRGIKKTAQAIRHTLGRSSVESGFSQYLIDSNKELSGLFEAKMFTMKRKPKKKTNKNDKESKEGEDLDSVELDENGYLDYKVPGVVCKNFDDTVLHLILARGHSPGDVQVLVGLDDGQGFNKIAFTIIEKDEEIREGRSKRSEELFPKVFKSSGVKKLFLAAVVPCVPENHHNQGVLLQALGMEGLEWSMTVDLKMANCLVGKSSGQPTFGCPFCDMPKPYTAATYNLLRLCDLSSLHEAYKDAGCPLKDQSKYQNCVNPHLLAGDPISTVLGIINIPSLHLLIGVVDKHLTGLENVFGVNWVDTFLKDVNIVRKSYQGSHALEGNQSSDFLKKLPVLERSILAESDDLKIEGLDLLESLRCFKAVQEDCFGQELRDGYKDSIRRFSNTYRGLKNMSITPKIHILEHHIPDFFSEKEESHGLGWYSEQCYEAMHHDMKVEWERLKICDPHHPDFSQRLLEFVCAYNARHI